jgi:hypothetical protein
MKRFLVFVVAVALLGSCRKEEPKTESVHFEFECISNPDTVIGFQIIFEKADLVIGNTVGCELGTCWSSPGWMPPLDSLEPVYVGEYCTTSARQLISGEQCIIRGSLFYTQNITGFEWSSKFYVNDSLIQIDTLNTVGVDHYYTVP